ncbi:hypothetical protein ACIPZ8_14030 [Pseudomonas sp. NPDC089422]|uniref:hypothetical protein n=1 Tax=Pseudomonas sp. NPDC089422 TaxID=3364466 RepID=UPI003824A806
MGIQRHSGKQENLAMYLLLHIEQAPDSGRNLKHGQTETYETMKTERARKLRCASYYHLKISKQADEPEQLKMNIRTKKNAAHWERRFLRYFTRA